MQNITVTTVCDRCGYREAQQRDALMGTIPRNISDDAIIASEREYVRVTYDTLLCKKCMEEFTAWKETPAHGSVSETQECGCPVIPDNG